MSEMRSRTGMQPLCLRLHRDLRSSSAGSLKFPDGGLRNDIVAAQTGVLMHR